VRRTDYSVWLKEKVNGRLLSKLYYTEAMSYFRQKYNGTLSKVAFVIASDDRKWCEDMFGFDQDVILTQSNQLINRAEFDLAILAQCNHSIIR
jgi:hypothetical protein